MLLFKIALRYLISMRKATVVQVLSTLSFTGILLGSMAMVVVLSAFNGFETLLRDLYHLQDADIRITRKGSKTFVPSVKNLESIRAIEGVAAVFEVLQDKAALRYGEGQMVVKVKGVPTAMLATTRMSAILKEGNYTLHLGSEPACLVGSNVQSALQISLRNPFEYLRLSYPKQKKLLQAGNPNILKNEAIKPSGIIETDENELIIPIDIARSLMDKPVGASALDMYIRADADPDQIKNEIGAILGSGYSIQTEDEQHADLFRVMKIEKLFVFLALGFIILISCFNLFVSSSMLVINKSEDFRILSALGLAPGQVGRLVRMAGLIIVNSGLVCGLITGLFICWIQTRYGIIPLGMSSTVIQSYPVDVQFADLILVSIWVLVAGNLALLVPSINAARSLQAGRKV